MRNFAYNWETWGYSEDKNNFQHFLLKHNLVLCIGILNTNQIKNIKLFKEIVPIISIKVFLDWFFVFSKYIVQ